MPTLPLPRGGTSLHGGDLPVSDGSDVLAQFADTHRLPEVAPVRDALCAAFAEIHTEYQDETAELMAQLDPLRATGDYLLNIAAEHEIVPAPGESEDDLRARIFASPNLVTPQAIVDAVNALLAPYTKVECQLVELEMDGWFVEDGTTNTGAFTPSSPASKIDPHYQDRYYPDDKAENGGFALSNNQPGGLLVSKGSPRNFHLRLPELAASDSDFSFCIDAGTTDIIAIFNGSQSDSADLTTTSSNNFVFNTSNTSDDVYASVVGTVESTKGQGISWSAYVDPYLA